MIHGKFTSKSPRDLFPGSKMWETALKWLENNQNNTQEGLYPLGEDGFYARIMSYSLKSRENARFEAHRHTIDLQYTISGAEGIEIAPTEALNPQNDYDEASDAKHFEKPAFPHAFVTNSTGFFTILYPEDAHMPKLDVPGVDSVVKLVIKIPSLFS
ncbi:MAG: YhcH/YjgK/YiaL family protein [Kiritimatiellae bacterium]|nr:YhcH/YjgK/YiaL family protein [Kiritimatiellia bacterium]